MLKWFSMSFAFVLLLQSSNIGIADILKLDDLITHAQYHDEEYGDNLFVFISKHYGELKASHNEQHKHEQSDHERLPFNHSQCSHHLTVMTFLDHSDRIDLKPIQFSERKQVNFYYNLPSSTAHTLGLLQPPRQA
jgi:hypothetical protein